MKKHLLRLSLYYVVLNIIIVFFTFSNILILGEKESEHDIYKCENVGSYADIGHHFKECNFKEFLFQIVFWLGAAFILTFSFIQPILIISGLISYYIFNFLSKKFEHISEMNFFVEFITLLIINILILYPLLFMIYSNIWDFSIDQL